MMNRSAFIKCSGQERVYLRYQTSALTEIKIKFVQVETGLLKPIDMVFTQ